MKKLKILLVAAALVATSALSFYMGREHEAKYYDFDGLFEVHQELRTKYDAAVKAASMFSDCIRLEYDLLEDYEKNSTYTAYSALEEWCYEDQIDIDSLLSEYVWCY